MRVFFILITFSTLFTGCMTSNFTLTGITYDTLPEDYPIEVILTGIDDKIEYEEIGALQVKQSSMDNLSKAVELAKKEARIRGGDILLLISSDSNISVSGNQYGVYSSERNSYIFVIGKMKK